MGSRKQFIPHFLLAFGLLFFPLTISNADPLDNWHWRIPPHPANNLTQVAYGNGAFVAVGGSSSILISTDQGTTWRAMPSGVVASLNGVTFDDDVFVAVGESGTIITSRDGVTWATRDSGTDVSLHRVAYGNGLFVAVGGDYQTGSSVVISSDSGETWTSKNLENSFVPSDITYGNGIFVAVGGGGTILTSSDGVSWESKFLGSSTPPFGVTYGNGLFVAVGGGITSRYHSFFKSSDGVNWTFESGDTFGTLRDVTYGNGIFVAVGGRYQSPSRILTSLDGLSWVEVKGAPTSLNIYNGVGYGNGRFIIVGDYGTILSSDDALTWVVETLLTEGLGGVSYGNGCLVAVGQNGAILSSIDGETWEVGDSAIGGWIYGVTYGEGMFVAVGSASTIQGNTGTIHTSSDRITWTARDSGVDGALMGITYANGIFVAVGSQIVTSHDGIEWTVKSQEGASAVAYGNGIFVAVSEGGTILISVNNGTTWRATNAGTVAGLKALAYGGGLFVAVGDGRDGTILTSSDGVTWTVRESRYALRGVGYSAGTFIAVGYDHILTSIDGITWTVRSAGGLSQGILYGVTFGKGTFVVVGRGGFQDSYGLILQSDIVAYTLQVTKTGFGTGTVTSSPVGIDCGSGCGEQSEEFNQDEVVTLTAIPATASVFTGWLGACGGTGTCVITMTAEAAVTATFKAIHTITATANPGGTISPSGKVSVYSGEEQIFTISPDDEQEVADVRVDGKSVGAVTTYTFTDVRSDHTIVATFRIKTYVITALSGQGGRISPSRSVRIKRGGRKTFTIIPRRGYRVEEVKVDGVSVGAATKYRFLNITSDHTIEATFKQK